MGVWGKTMGGDVRLITNSVVCMKTGGESARLFCSEFFLSIKNRCNLGNVFDAYIGFATAVDLLMHSARDTQTAWTCWLFLSSD